MLFYERQLASVIGAASARALVGAIVEEQPLAVEEVIRILDETSRLIETNAALETATAELKQANERLRRKNQHLMATRRESSRNNGKLHSSFAVIYGLACLLFVISGWLIR